MSFMPFINKLKEHHNITTPKNIIKHDHLYNTLIFITKCTINDNQIPHDSIFILLIN